MGAKLTYFIYEIIKTHSTVALSTFDNTHFLDNLWFKKKSCRQFIFFSTPGDMTYHLSIRRKILHKGICGL